MLNVLLICLVCSIVAGNIQDFSVRLNNALANNTKTGRLEIYYSEVWGTVCNDGFTDASARVACASLGFAYIGTVIYNTNGPGAGQIWLDDVNCVGTESGIEQCAHLPWGNNNCNHTKDVSITCDCGNKYFNGLAGTISSPKFPMQYADSLACNNSITVPSGRTIIITFSAFSTEPCCDFVTISCEPGSNVTSIRYSGQGIPSVITLSSCRSVNVYFRTDGSVISTGFNLSYIITSDIIIGGFTTKPSNAFLRSDKNDPIVFNCTSASMYLPWWRININFISSDTYRITNSTCGVIASASYSYWFKTESLGPGSCNLIVNAPAGSLYLLTGSVFCTDSTLSTARALIASPLNPQFNFTNDVNTSAALTDLIRDEELKISCSPSFINSYSYPSLDFTYLLYTGGFSTVHMSILRTYWTSEGRNISSTDTFNASSYVLIKAGVDEIPSYTCNVVLYSFSNFTDMADNFPVEISVNTKPVEVLYWPTEDTMTIVGDYNGEIRTPAVLSCNVASNPPATYTWIDENNGNVTNGQFITINNGGLYTCNGSNIIRGQVYQTSKSIKLQVVEYGPDRFKTITIILGALLGAAVLTIIILLVILLCKRCRQQKTETVSAVGNKNAGIDHELQHRAGRYNSYEADSGNDVDASRTPYENLAGLHGSRTQSIFPDIYEELDNRQ